MDDPELIRRGAGNYAAMCEGCHLAPGEAPGEIQRGMYPAPPDLSRGTARSAAEIFWIVKHGLKMTGMPAWGRSMGDAPIEAMTAFVLRLPAMSPEDYRAWVDASPGHDHGGGPSDEEEQVPVGRQHPDSAPHAH